jgi:uroporphyrinogen decarboxylase
MKHRQLIEATIRRTGHGNTSGFWVGHPTAEAKAIYSQALGLGDQHQDAHVEGSVLLSDNCDSREIEFQKAIGSDMVWVTPELDPTAWKHPEGKPMWDCFDHNRESLGDAGVFAECEDVDEVEAFPWPDPKYLDFSSTIANTKLAYDSGMAVFGGMWCPFFHILSDFFGMENYFVKMYTDPEVVQAATRHVVDFLVEANKALLKETAPYLSAGFFGNDLGTQISMMLSLECFDEFILPSIRRIVATIKEAGLPVSIHSCGAIEPIIPRLIEAGVDILHPLQAKARGMDAETLASKYKGKLIFMGGVDTQQLLPFGTPEQVREEVLRLRDVFGDDFIVSPSHEALLPIVPFENVMAMSQAAKE